MRGRIDKKKPQEPGQLIPRGLVNMAGRCSHQIGKTKDIAVLNVVTMLLQNVQALIKIKIKTIIKGY